MEFVLFRRRSVWWPTWKASLLLLVFLVAPIFAWAWWGEHFLAITDRALAADTLVVESWIQEDGLHAAADEYLTGNYQYLVITGGMTGSPGALRRQSYAEIAQRELISAGIDRESMIAAPMPDVHSQRTHATAVAVREALEARGVEPFAINVFTEGAHARRSRLVYSKVFPPDVKVGAVAWTPWLRTTGTPAWWTSSERTVDMIKETLGYPYEVLFSSGRGW